MSLQAVWIRNNMLGNGDLWQNRQPTEAELKVQRSLQKLSIPEWYLNKSSKPPKILSNNTPIESRPPSWKTGTYKIERKVDDKKKIPSKKKIPPIDATFQKPRLSQNISKTFPRVSPSRKIQNINIVFPQLKNINIKTENPAEDSDKENDPVKTPKKESTFEKIGTPFKTPINEFKIRAVSTPKGSPASLFSASEFNATEKKENEAFLETNFAKDARKNLDENFDATYDFDNYDDSMDEDQPPEIATPATRFFNSKTKSRTLEKIVKSKMARKKSLIQEIIDDLNQKCQLSKSIESAPENPLNVSYSAAHVSLNNSVKELVSALETRGAKMQQKQAEAFDEDEGDSFEDGSESDVNSTASSTSLSFKDSDSEPDTLSKIEENEAEGYDEDEGGSSLDSSEPDIKSAASSTSLSFKDSDSESDPLPTHNEFMKLNEEATIKEEEKDEDDSVYWIPIAKCKLPRTSSLLSMMSRLSTYSQISPCMSPISHEHQNTLRSNYSTWGKTYKKTGKSGNLFRIEESVHADSGYYGRSGINSMGSAGSTVTHSSASSFDETEESLSRVTAV